MPRKADEQPVRPDAVGRRLADHVVAGADRLLQYRPKRLAVNRSTDDGPTEIDAGAGVPAGVSNVDE